MNFMFALQFLKIDIPRAVACHRAAEDTASLLACLLWLLILFLLLMYSGTKIYSSLTPCVTFYSHPSSFYFVISRPLCVLLNDNFDWFWFCSYNSLQGIQNYSTNGIDVFCRFSPSLLSLNWIQWKLSKRYPHSKITLLEYHICVARIVFRPF
jgi:hypothetical protein